MSVTRTARNRRRQPTKPIEGNSSSYPIVVHRSDSQVRRPKQLLTSMFRDLMASRELALQLMHRNISAQYRQSFLGFFWAIIPPVVTALGLTLARSKGVVNIQETDLPYPAYVMFSMALWQTFVEAITGPMQSLTSAKNMLVRINFPREALVLSKVGELFFNFGAKLILIIILFIFFKMPITWNALLAPVALIHLVVFGTFIGVLLAPAAVLYQDFTKGISLVTNFWLLLTPVVYAPPSDGVFGAVVRLNPVTPLLVTTRELATTGVISDPQGFWIASLIGFLGLLLAWILYRLAIPYVVERMSS